MGLELILPLVLGAGIIEQFDQAVLKTFRLDELMDHSLAVATGAQRLAGQCCEDEELIADCMLVGILHDVGKLVLASNLTDSYREAFELAAQNQLPLFQAESQVFGATHADVGGYLVDLWGFPNPVVEAVALHHSPATSDSDEFTLLTAIHLADALSHFAGSADNQFGSVAVDREYLSRLGKEGFRDRWQEYLPEELPASVGP